MRSAECFLTSSGVNGNECGKVDTNGMKYAPDSLGEFLRRQAETQADFTYSILGNVISIVDLDLGKRSVTNDIESVLRDGIDWNGKQATFFAARNRRRTSSK